MNYALRGLYYLIKSSRQKNLSLVLKQLVNYSAAYLKISKYVPLPTSLQIEPSATCNLRCTMCNLDKSIDPNRLMTAPQFKQIITQAQPLSALNLTGMGESLINPSFPEILRIANQEGIPTAFVTNAQLLNPSRIDEIVKSGVECIAVSIESGLPKTYEKIRLGATYRRLASNLLQLTTAAHKANPSLEIVFNVVIFKSTLDNLNHIRSIFKLANASGIKRIAFQNTSSLAETKMGYYYQHPQQLKSKFNQINQMALKYKIAINLPSIKPRPGSCYYPWIYPQITASGEMLPCCVVAQFDKYSTIVKQYSFGNVLKSNFATVWNSAKANDFRRQLRSSNPPPCCRQCSKYQGVL